MRKFVKTFCWPPDDIKFQITHHARGLSAAVHTLDPDSEMYPYLHGCLVAPEKRLAQDLEHAEMMLQAEILAEEAEAALDSGDHLEARTKIGKSLDLIEKAGRRDNTCRATAWVNSGDILLKTGFFDEAAEAFQKAVDLLEACLYEGELLDYSKSALTRALSGLTEHTLLPPAPFSPSFFEELN